MRNGKRCSIPILWGGEFTVRWCRFRQAAAADLDEALAWARKVAEATNHPIEVRPFRATGRLKAPAAP